MSFSRRINREYKQLILDHTNENMFFDKSPIEYTKLFEIMLAYTK